MGKKYYGGIGTDKGFVMHSPGNEYRYDLDDEFHEEGNEENVDGASSAGGAERTRILVLAEQGNRVRVPDTWKLQT